MKRYTWRDGTGWVDKRSGEPMDKPYAGQISAPMVMRDIPEYASPITGQPITSRSHRREDLIKHGCIEVDPPRKPKLFKNARFAKKHGLPLNPEIVNK